jgi:hypothetical protein
MRIAMNWVYDGIYISGIRAMKNPDKVKEEGITAIVRLDIGSILTGAESWSTTDFIVLEEPFPDADYIPDGIIPKVTRFIDEQIENDGMVLVHCAMGISRSVSMVMAYLIEYEGMNLAEAFGTVREGRTIARPHPRLLASLIAHYDLPYNPLEAHNPNFIGRLMKDV